MCFGPQAYFADGNKVSLTIHFFATFFFIIVNYVMSYSNIFKFSLFP